MVVPEWEAEAVGEAEGQPLACGVALAHTLVLRLRVGEEEAERERVTVTLALALREAVLQCEALGVALGQGVTLRLRLPLALALAERHRVGEGEGVAPLLVEALDVVLWLGEEAWLGEPPALALAPVLQLAVLLEEGRAEALPAVAVALPLLDTEAVGVLEAASDPVATGVSEGSGDSEADCDCEAEPLAEGLQVSPSRRRRCKACAGRGTAGGKKLPRAAVEGAGRARRTDRPPLCSACSVVERAGRARKESQATPARQARERRQQKVRCNERCMVPVGCSAKRCAALPAIANTGALSQIQPCVCHTQYLTIIHFCPNQ